MQWKENLVQKAWIFWRVELQLNTEIPHFAVWSWFPYYSPLLDGPAHKCVDWRTTCNMVWSFKEVLAIRVWMILSFCCNFAKKIRFYKHKFWANNIIMKTFGQYWRPSGDFICTFLISFTCDSDIFNYSSISRCCWSKMTTQMINCNQFSFNFAGPQKR